MGEQRFNALTAKCHKYIKYSTIAFGSADNGNSEMRLDHPSQSYGSAGIARRLQRKLEAPALGNTPYNRYDPVSAFAAQAALAD
jgi:hypothetical protein